jgi:DNA-directed RNA polymerase specialized sigma24 family protein
VKWTEAHDDYLRACVDEAVPYPQIAAHLGRTPASVRCRVYRLFDKAPRKRHWTPAAVRDVLRLREDGLTCREIGDLFGVTRAAIQKLIQRYTRGER